MTKDQSDLLKIEQIKKEAERQKALSKKSYKSFKKRCATGSHNSLSLQPLKPKPPTEPVEFHFKTDERLKDTPIGHTPSAASHDSLFPNNLRISDRPDYNPNDPSEVQYMYICICTCICVLQKVAISPEPKRPCPPKLVCMHFTSTSTCINFLSRFNFLTPWTIVHGLKGKFGRF